MRASRMRRRCAEAVLSVHHFAGTITKRPTFAEINLGPC
jgi:hypothetical protein